MYYQFKYNNIKYSLIKVNKLFNKYLIPKCYTENIRNNRNLLDINRSLPIHFVVYNNTKYIINGIEYLNIFNNKKIPIIQIQADNITDIDFYFNSINTNIIKKRNIIITETYNHFITNYPNSFRYNGIRRPFLNNNIFLNNLEIIYDKTYNDIHNTNNFVSLLVNLNNKYKLKNKDWFPSKGKFNNINLINYIENNNCLYFGMIPDKWFLHIDNLPKYI